MDNHEINQGRRRFLVLATAGAGGLAAAGVAAPFVASWFPSEKAKAAGAPIEIDVSKIESGQMLTAEWQGTPIWVQSGKAVSSARATAPDSTLPGAFMPVRLPRPIWLFLPINT